MSKIITSLFLLIGFTLGVVTLNAQRKPAAANRAEFSMFELLPVADTGYISIFTDKQEQPTIARLVLTGPNDKIINIQEVSLVQRGLLAQLEGAFLWQGQLVIVSSLFYPGPQRDLLFIRRYRLSDFVEVDSEQIAEAYVPGRLRVPFGYALSPDSTKLMFYSWTYAVPEDPVKMEIHVLDQKLQRLWHKRFLLPNKNANFYIYACRVDNDGNSYLLCEDYKGKVGAQTRIQDEKIERFVLRLSENSDEATAFTIQLTDKVITDLKFTMDEDGNLLGGGFYREGNKLTLDGVFAYRIDQQTQGYRKWEFPLNKDTYEAIHPYSENGKYVSGTRQFRDFFIDHLNWDKDRGLTMIAEQRLYEQDEDKYNDILVVQLDKDMKKDWMLRIPKKQAAFWTLTDFISYQFLKRGNRQYVLYNDLPDNLPDGGEKPKRIKDLNFVFEEPNNIAVHMVEIEPGGKLLHQNLS
ncbi:MAG: hypothetical protein KDD15_18610, partial [Lewinella sp.]|nr:hypothetical protein [Lewinella sp.]